MTPSWYDVLDVDESATAEEIRAVWRERIADLDPSESRFRRLNQAAEVLLDPERRAAHDAELALGSADDESDLGPAVEPALAATPPASPGGPVISGSGPPSWVLIAVALVTATSLAWTGYLWRDRPAEGLGSIEEATSAAQAAAERAIVPLLSYDYRTLDEDKAAADAVLTPEFGAEYDKLFPVLTQNAPQTETVVTAEVVGSGVVRPGTERADIYVFVNRPTARKDVPDETSRDQVTVQMQLIDGVWLVNCLITTPTGNCG